MTAPRVFCCLLLLVCSAMGDCTYLRMSDYETVYKEQKIVTKKETVDEEAGMYDNQTENKELEIDTKNEAVDEEGEREDHGIVDELENTTGKETVDKDGYYLDLRTNSYYKLYHELNTWFDAQSRCYSDGGNLAVINSPLEARVLAELFAKHPLQDDYHDSCAFIGFLLLQMVEPKKNIWITIPDYSITLEQAGYAQWGDGEPNNAAGDEFYGCMLRDGRLNDESNNKTHPFICEKPNFADNVNVRQY